MHQHLTTKIKGRERATATVSPMFDDDRSKDGEIDLLDPSRCKSGTLPPLLFFLHRVLLFPRQLWSQLTRFSVCFGPLFISNWHYDVGRQLQKCIGIVYSKYLRQGRAMYLLPIHSYRQLRFACSDGQPRTRPVLASHRGRVAETARSAVHDVPEPYRPQRLLGPVHLLIFDPSVPAVPTRAFLPNTG